MLEFLYSLPDFAFAMVGDVSANERVLFACGSPATLYARVQCRFGYRGQRDKVAVSFVLPTSAGVEVLTIGIHVAAWGTLPPATWKHMILSYLPMGVLDYPVPM